MLRTIRIAMLAIVAATSLAAGVGSSRAEADYLRLRPLKEPACAGKVKSVDCVAAPRINKRKSTIPGIQNPDYGRPPVIVVQPLSRPATSGFRTLGGNYGITGGQ